jgi:hypothetical protein
MPSKAAKSQKNHREINQLASGSKSFPTLMFSTHATIPTLGTVFTE